ncbi:circadian clock-controlled protein daywake-like [Amyelois transitella]|uniref:circadian clock-controlled protein daywake-like n=1 Tax=Amyelois transitella TaxID=680683 RepID=UPI00298F879D|nr:circadian clock-controlled protein daywake-like [Amyelois transitella]
MKSLIILVACALFCSCNGQMEVSFITSCTQEDRRCLKSSAQRAVPVIAAGVPQLSMKPLDPMQLPRILANQAGLKMDFRNSVVKGLRNCLVEDIVRHGDAMSITMKCSATVVGDYSLDGRLLVMPIKGEGRYKIKIRDIVVKFSFEMGHRESGGEKYWTFETWRYTSRVDNNVNFQFQNLFNGNKELSDSVHQFANGNWRDIFKELSPPILDAVMKEIVTEVRKLFNNVPMRKLALD